MDRFDMARYTPRASMTSIERQRPPCEETGDLGAGETMCVCMLCFAFVASTGAQGAGAADSSSSNASALFGVVNGGALEVFAFVGPSGESLAATLDAGAAALSLRLTHPFESIEVHAAHADGTRPQLHQSADRTYFGLATIESPAHTAASVALPTLPTHAARTTSRSRDRRARSRLATLRPSRLRRPWSRAKSDSFTATRNTPTSRPPTMHTTARARTSS